MKNIFILSALGLFLSYGVEAQKVTSTAGKHFYGSTTTLNWTIGEPIIKTHYGTANILSQGFHQIFPSTCNLNLTTSTTNANCGNTDGSASVSVSGGTPPYSYQWTSGVTLATADSLPAGIYIVTVTDSTGCSDFIAATVSDNNGPAITEVVTNVNCNGGSDGAIDISVSGGTTPYTYYWSNGSITQDISGLPAGPYEITLTDANDCIANKSITVNEPAALNLNITTADASCGNADGTAVVTVSGGITPYSYSWSSGGTASIETGLAAGVYAVAVTDSSGCTAIASAAVSDTGAATITIDSILNEDCGSTGGSIYISATGGATPYTYVWSNSSSAQNLVNVPAGDYDIMITSSNGCIATANATITGQQPPLQSICLVTVDSASGNNEIVWEKSPGPASYNIYRESTQSGVYFLAGNVPYNSLSTFIDPLSNPAQKSYRYKISAVDTCGNESGLSTEHKTIHLNINQGLGGDINLIWDHYEGFAFSTYYIYRYTTPTGWEVIDSIQSTLNSVTDPSPPQANLWYQVLVKPPSVCTANKAKNFNSSKSNSTSISLSGILSSTVTAQDATQGICDGEATVTASNGTPPYIYLWNDPNNQTTATATGLCGNTSYTVTVADANNGITSATVTVGEQTGITGNDFANNVKIYPNPNTGTFTIEILALSASPERSRRGAEVQIKIFNVLGQQVAPILSRSMPGDKNMIEVDMTGHLTGIYNLQLLSINGTINYKIVIEK